MMRILIIILIVLVGAAVLSQLSPSAEKSTNPIIKGLATVQSWFPGAAAPKLPGSDAASDDKQTIVYKWQDNAGEWHFSNQPPPKNIASSVKTYRSDINITQTPSLPPVETKQPTSAKPRDIPTSAAPLLPITDPERVKQLIDDAKNVQNLVNNRQMTLNKNIEP